MEREARNGEGCSCETEGAVVRSQGGVVLVEMSVFATFFGLADSSPFTHPDIVPYGGISGNIIKLPH